MAEYWPSSLFARNSACDCPLYCGAPKEQSSLNWMTCILREILKDHPRKTEKIAIFRIIILQMRLDVFFVHFVRHIYIFRGKSLSYLCPCEISCDIPRRLNEVVGWWAYTLNTPILRPGVNFSRNNKMVKRRRDIRVFYGQNSWDSDPRRHYYLIFFQYSLFLE